MEALHYNENKVRKQAITKDGTKRFAVQYPKYMKRGYIVRKIVEYRQKYTIPHGGYSVLQSDMEVDHHKPFLDCSHSTPQKTTSPFNLTPK